MKDYNMPDCRLIARTGSGRNARRMNSHTACVPAKIYNQRTSGFCELSPDLYAVWWCEVELVSGLDVESRIPGVDVADPVCAVLGGGVRVGHHLLAERGFTLFRSPVLSEGDEELLVAGESVLGGGGLASERGVVGIERCGDTGVVGNVFRKRLLAVHGKVGKRFVAVVLRGESGGGGFEMGEVGGRPPIADSAFGVKGAAFGVECMTDFVPDHGADSAIVRGAGSEWIEERWLQDGGGKAKRVLQRQVDGIHGLGLHRPFLAINGMSETGDIVVVIEQAPAPEIAEDVIRLDIVGGVVAPGVGVTDSHIESGEFNLGFGFGGGIHPIEGVDALAECRDDVCDHGFRLGFGLRREVTLGIDLSDGVAEKAIDGRDAALPAWTLFCCAGECLAEEGEAFVSQGFGQHGGVGLDEVERQPVFPGFEIGGGDESGFAGEGCRLPDDEAGLIAEAGGAKVFCPIQAGGFGGKVGWLQGVVGFLVSLFPASVRCLSAMACSRSTIRWARASVSV